MCAGQDERVCERGDIKTRSGLIDSSRLGVGLSPFIDELSDSRPGLLGYKTGDCGLSGVVAEL